MLWSFSLLFTAFLIVVLLKACGSNTETSTGSNTETSTVQNEPTKISEMGGFVSYSEIYVDEETNVMYLFSKNGYGGGLTTMLNADEMPKTK